MRRVSLPWALAAVVAASQVSNTMAAERAKADVFCQPGSKSLQYDCTIKLTNARTGAPVTKVNLTVGADMPSMPMMHNVRPVSAISTEEPGTYRARIELEMHGDWVLQLNLSGEIKDRLVNPMRFDGDDAAQKPPAPSRHKH
jgi:hypothetical protein